MKGYSEREQQQFVASAKVIVDIMRNKEDVSDEEFGKRLMATGVFTKKELKAPVTMTVGQQMEDSLRILRLQRIATEKKMEEKHSSPRP